MCSIRWAQCGMLYNNVTFPILQFLPFYILLLYFILLFSFYYIVLQDVKAAAARTNRCSFIPTFSCFLFLCNAAHLPNSFIHSLAWSSFSQSSCIDCAFTTETVERSTERIERCSCCKSEKRGRK